MKTLVCNVLFFMCFSAFAQKSPTSIDKYAGKVLIAKVSCQLKQSIYVGDSTAVTYDDFLQCLNTQKDILKTSFDLAVKAVKKPAAKTALKEHYIGMVSFLKGLDAVNGETKRSYDSRQAVSTQKLNDLWTRFEVEE